LPSASSAAAQEPLRLLGSALGERDPAADGLELNAGLPREVLLAWVRHAFRELLQAGHRLASFG